MLPIPANVSFAIYRGGAFPPADPAATGVSGYLDGAYDAGLEHSEQTAGLRYTHLLIVDLAVDLRDDFFEFGAIGQADRIYLPDAAGTPFDVVFVERLFRGTGPDVKRAYLQRRQPASWPSANL
jgi:hypothetical protein